MNEKNVFVRTFVISFYYGAGSDFLTSSGSGFTRQKFTVPTVPVPVPVPQHYPQAFFNLMFYKPVQYFYAQVPAYEARTPVTPRSSPTLLEDPGAAQSPQPLCSPGILTPLASEGEEGEGGQASSFSNTRETCV